MSDTMFGSSHRVQLDLFEIDKNTQAENQIEVVSLGDGLDFAFIRPDKPAVDLSNTRLFGDDSLSGFEVTEVSESGSVPVLLATNSTEYDVLLIAGQLVQGGKQNRGINADILVAKGKSAQIPVTCVEQGRWNGAPRSRFRFGGFEPMSVRCAKAQQVSDSRRHRGSAEANQRVVWSEIASLSAKLGAQSASSDLLHAAKVAKERRESRPTEAAAESADRLSAIRQRISECLGEQRDLQAELERHLPELLHGLGGTASNETVEALRERIRTLSREMSALRAERRLTTPPPEAPGRAVRSEAISAADATAKGASGLLVFFDGEFVAGDLFADPNWFAKVYGDLRDSALLSWEAANPPRRPESRRTASRTLAKSIVHDALRGEWTPRRSIAHGRSLLLEHPYLESSVLADDTGVPLHLLIGTRQLPDALRPNR